MTQSAPSLTQSMSALNDAPIGKAEACKMLEAFARCDYDILRLKAVQGLRDLRATGSVPLLIEALRDDDEDVRVDAAESLGLLGDESAIPALLENLSYDPCADVKLSVVRALGQLGAKEAAPILRQLVVGRGEEIEWDEDEFHRDEWDGWLDIQIAAIDALAGLKDSEAIEPIMLALNDPDNQDLSVQGMNALAAMGDPALPSLGICAQSANRRRRFHAVRALSNMPSDKALQLLEKALDDADHDIRILAFETLLKRKPSVELFERALEDNSDQVRMAALDKLELDQMGYLQRALQDPSPKVQLALIQRLAKAQSGSPINTREQPFFKALYILFETSGVEVSASALGALAALAPDLIEKELKDLFERTDMAKDEQEQRQWAVVDGLAKRQDECSLDWLQTACASSSRSVRLKALAAIGLLAGHEDLNEDLKIRALAVLVAFGRSRSLDDQQETEADPEEEAMDSSAVSEEENPAARDQQTEADDTNQPDLDAMKEAGLDLGDEKDQSEGPTSSLGAILGHEAIAKDLIEEAAEQDDSAHLDINEQALLNQARRNLSRRKISLDGDAEQIEQELCLTAIHLMGDHALTSDHLIQIAQCDKNDKALAALEALSRLVDLAEDPMRALLPLKAEDVAGNTAPESMVSSPVEQVVKASLSASDVALQRQALRLLSKIPQTLLVDKSVLFDLTTHCLKDADSTIRSDAMAAYLALGGECADIVPFLKDASALTRQDAMRLLARKAPTLAIDHILDFLLNNPEQSMKSLLGEDVMATTLDQNERQKLASSLVAKLTDDKVKAEWTIILPAITELFIE